MRVRAYIEATYDINTDDPDLLDAYQVKNRSAAAILDAEQRFLDEDGDYMLMMLASPETDVRLVAVSVLAPDEGKA